MTKEGVKRRHKTEEGYHPRDGDATCPCFFVRHGQAAGGALFRTIVREVAMRSLIIALAVGIAVYAALPAAAQERAAQQPAAGGLREHFQDLNLTDEQEAKIADIRKECQPQVQEAAKDLATVVKEEVEKARGVLTDEQKAKVAATKEERPERPERRAEHLAERTAHLEQLDLTDAEKERITAIREEYRPKIAQALESLRGTLTDAQRQAREEALKAGKKRREVIASLNLTGEQKEKVEAVGKELRTLVREELEKMRDVLSEGQQQQLQEFKEERKEHVRDRMAHAITNLRDLNLTAEQKTQLTDIRKEYRPRVQEAGNKLRAAVRKEVEEIVAVLKG
jgi:Spy/CpxP family protein refolding chaperone